MPGSLQQTHQPLILDAYEEYLTQRVSRGEIRDSTKQLHLQRANRIFEACLRSLSPEALLGLTLVWFAATRKSGGGYRRVIRELNGLIEGRYREPFLHAQ